MILKRIFRFVCALLPAALLTVGCQQDDFYHASMPHADGEGVTLSFSSDPMQPYKVTTRSSDAKEDEEKEIKTLHVFFFDARGEWLTGSYLTGYTGATGATEQGGYIAPSQGTTLLKIDREGFDDQSAAQTATVYAVANVEESLFQELDANGRPAILNQEGKTPLEVLQSLDYRPGTFFVTTLPDTGMPMTGSKMVDLTKEEITDDNERVIELQALMARIDVNLQLNSDISDSNLPSMLLTSWTVKNLPTQVSFTPTQTGGTTALTTDTKRDYTDNRGVQTIYNRQGSIELSFYMFENVQQPDANASISYPTDIEEYQKQRYKPDWANENATAIVFHTQYTTYNNANYMVDYTLYLGKNHTDNYEVQRNHQYKNNITIKGLTSQTEAGGEFTYDARVDIEENTSKYYISILRERNHDAHFCVTPMDVYLFADASAKPSMKVEFLNNTDLDANNQPWIRMEKIPAANMQDGTLPAGMTTDDHLIAGSNFTAGHGKRKYFTTDLVTNTLAETGKEITIDNTRDRIYFYIDENLSDSQDRTAVVKLTYYENGTMVNERTLDITQTHFLKVQVYDRSGNRPDYSRPYGNDDDFGPAYRVGSKPEDGIIYMEQYEEYLDHYDPLDKYATDQIYTGLEWGCDGESVSDEQNYLNGLYYTQEIVTETGQAVMTLNDVPRSAAAYCYNRNKREPKGSDHYGSVYYERDGNGIFPPYTYRTNCKYFLPGIRQMEDALTQYYTTFPEFQGNYYWSSAAGEAIVGMDNTRARATKVNADGSYVESGRNDNYPNGGSAPRSGVYLRIRAFRSDLKPLEY